MPRSLLTAMDNSVGSETQVTVGTGVTPVLQANPDRLSCFFPACASGSYFISTDPNMATNTGITIVATSPGVTLCKELHGGIVTKAWYAIAVAPRTFGIVEALDTHRATKVDQ